MTALLERAVLRRLEAGCAAPVGIAATLETRDEHGDDGGDAAGAGSRAVVRLVAEVYALDGAQSVRVERNVPKIEAQGAAGREDAAERVVAELLDRGAGELADLAGTGR